MQLMRSACAQVRKKQKDGKVDTELVYAYAKAGLMGPLEEFIGGTHQANLQACGDRCAWAAWGGFECMGGWDSLLGAPIRPTCKLAETGVHGVQGAIRC